MPDGLEVLHVGGDHAGEPRDPGADPDAAVDSVNQFRPKSCQNINITMLHSLYSNKLPKSKRLC
jgi:hypothetical protein